tara:strand:+ start:475 stop:675 length:201 start_codon:yes stop_codon:yes gene_type:complete
MKYSDNNNFLRPNSLWTKDSRFNVLEKAKYYEFVDMQSHDSWSGTQMYEDTIISRDNGKTFKEESN